MNLKNLINIFSDKKCTKLYVKELQKNNNSKQQIYIAAGDVQVLNIFPLKGFYPVSLGSRKRISFHSPISFFWLSNDGQKTLAPHAKFILYPDYPEVRFSGFVRGCSNAPSEILNNAVAGRLLFFGISENGDVFGYIVNPEDEIAREFKQTLVIEKFGVIHSIAIDKNRIVFNSKKTLIEELARIYRKGWIDSKRLDKNGMLIECNAPQCGGYTLEAELGIKPNGFAEPDYLGWEIKQFNVKNFQRLNSSVITVMTPEPDGGFYVEKGVRQFVRSYGYPDSVIEGRINFGGIYKAEVVNRRTKLRMQIEGYDLQRGKITDPTGGLFLLDGQDNNTASWSFSSILTHWNKKHAKAGYIPSMVLKSPQRKYHYGSNIILGEGTDFSLFLKQFALGNIYYDPAIKVFNEGGKEKDKRRSQFRVKSNYVSSLYNKSESVDLEDFF